GVQQRHRGFPSGSCIKEEREGYAFVTEIISKSDPILGLSLSDYRTVLGSYLSVTVDILHPYPARPVPVRKVITLLINTVENIIKINADGVPDKPAVIQVIVFCPVTVGIT